MKNNRREVLKMGYESKIYVVEKSDMKNENNKRYARVITSYDMSKFDRFGGIFKTESDCYIYADDGNTEITTDMYDEPLTEASIDVVINYLEKFAIEQDYYRRVNPLLGLLKGFKLVDWNNLTVIHYGY
jgi:hypothetical protein